MINREFFRKHQKKLVWFANAPLIKRWFRWVLRIRKSDCGLDDRIVAILPNAYFVDLGKSKYRADFRTHNKFAKRIYYAFEPMWWLIHAWDIIFANRFFPQLNFDFDTLTVYPDPDPETTTVDGHLQSPYGDDTWATRHDASVGNAVYPSTTSDRAMLIETSETAANVWQISRSMYLFDTSSLGATATISATVLSLYGNAKTDGATTISPDIDIYTSTPATNTNLITDDFDQFGTTSQTGSPITYANWSTTGYNAFTFNATGRGNVSKTGVSKFGARNANYDAANINPGTTTDVLHEMSCYFADASGTTTDPKLVVTYTTITFIPRVMIY